MAYSIPPTETIAETKTCKHCVTDFPITNKDLEFYDKVSPVFAGAKYAIPTPTLCPDCRQQRRLSFRNERKLYKRKCDATGKDIVSMYSPDKPFKVYHQDYWWGDAWDPTDSGRDFDFTRPFFEQFAELAETVPKINSVVLGNEDSPFVNFVWYSKKIHMSSDVLYSEDVYFSNMIKNVRDGIDLFDVQDSDNCFECVGSQKLHNCHRVIWSENCTNSSFLDSCNGVSNSLFCVNLTNKNFFILNERVSEWTYAEVLDLIRANQHGEYLARYEKLLKSAPRKHLRNSNAKNSTGELLKNTNNAIDCYQSIDIENCKYVSVWQDMADCMDTTIHNPDCFLDYEAISGWRLKNAICNSATIESNHVSYCSECFNSSHLFACIGLRNKEYCVFNKQYTREEYEALVPKIIEHMCGTLEWGEFFPSSISPFGYNETMAQEYYPLTREEALAHGFAWSDYEPPFPKVEKTIPAAKLPENIEDVPDDILNWAIECEVTKKPFRIIKQELEFYRKHRLPIPRRHPNQRHLDRMALRNPRKLFERKCDKCDKEMVTTYAPERLETVYCEECYEREVVG